MRRRKQVVPVEEPTKGTAAILNVEDLIAMSAYDLACQAWPALISVCEDAKFEAHLTYLPDDLEAAVKELREHGWCRGRYRASNGALDVAGALCMGLDGQPNPAVLSGQKARRFEFACECIATEADADDIYTWNDEIVKRKRDVLTALSAMARDERYCARQEAKSS